MFKIQEKMKFFLQMEWPYSERAMQLSPYLDVEIRVG